MKPAKLYSAALITGSLLLGTPALADQQHSDERRCDKAEHQHNGHHAKHESPTKAFKQMLRGLDLSPEQRTHVREIMKSAAPQLIDHMGAMQEQRISFQELLLSDSLDKKDLRNSIKTHAETLSNMMMLSAEVKADIFDILSPEQRELIKERIKTRYRQT